MKQVDLLQPVCARLRCWALVPAEIPVEVRDDVVLLRVCGRELGHPGMHVAGVFAWSDPPAQAYTAEAHWASLSASWQHRTLERVMLELRSAGLGLPKAIRLELVRQFVREIEC